MKVSILGAAKQVPGSMSLYEAGGLKILVDCGMEQTNDVRTDMIKNIKQFPFNPRELDYVIVTHAHIDHCGLIPYLVKCGYRGPILSTIPTLDICAISLVDCAFIWQREIQKALKSIEVKKKTVKLNNGMLKCPYSIEEAELAMNYFRGYDFGKEIKLNDDVKLIFRHAGHIMGAASLEFHVRKNEYEEEVVLFTGDISGKKDIHPFVEPVEYIKKADYVICESTYGNKKHNKSVSPEKFLLDKIQKHCIDHGKTLLIATFSVQRTQEVIYYLNRIYNANKDNKQLQKIPIYVDSPMSINVTKNVYETSPEFYGNDTGLSKEEMQDILRWDRITYTETPAQSQSLANGNPKIILSSAGMMSSGRIVNHIESFLPVKNACVLLSGYCAPETFGGRLQQAVAAGKTKITSVMGHELNIRADVCKIEGLSGHSDMNSTINYLRNIKGVKKVILNHGEIDAIEQLKDEIEKQLKLNVIVPNLNQTIKLQK